MTQLAYLPCPVRSHVISMSTTGRHVAARLPGAIEIVDALGIAPACTIEGDAIDFACVGTTLWVLRDRRVERYALGSGRLVEHAIELAEPGVGLCAEASGSAIVEGTRQTLVSPDGNTTAIPHAAAAFPLGGMRVAAVIDARLCLLELGRRQPMVSLRIPGQIRSVHALHGGRAIAILVRETGEDSWWVVRPDGSRIHRIAAPRATRWAVAADAGLAVICGSTGQLTCIDLRYGRIRSECGTPIAIEDLDVSTDGQHVVLAHTDDSGRPVMLHLPAAELFARTAVGAAAPVLELEPQPPLADEPQAEAPREVPALAVATAIPATLPLAFGAPLPPLPAGGPSEWLPYGSPREHLEDMLDLVAARAARAVAEAWDTGRLGGIEHRLRRGSPRVARARARPRLGRARRSRALPRPGDGTQRGSHPRGDRGGHAATVHRAAARARSARRWPVTS